MTKGVKSDGRIENVTSIETGKGTKGDSGIGPMEETKTEVVKKLESV